MQSQETFHDVMAEHLRRAPWLAISVLVHAICMLILLQIPVRKRQQHNPIVLVAQPAEQDEEIEVLLKQL